MDRRRFSRNILLLGLGVLVLKANIPAGSIEPGQFREEARKLPVREFDVVVAGGGTAGVVAAIASARQGAKTVFIRLGFEGGGSKDSKLPAEFVQGLRQLGSGLITTTVHDNYFMFIKVNYKMSVSPTNRDQVALSELLIRQNQYKTLGLFKKYLPGCENAFIARTSPSLNIRRGRTITCDYDISLDDVLQGRHFDDDIMAYGFHDESPRYKIKNGGSYGVPYKALIVKDINNLFATGMMITSDYHAHMSTRNTICCMGQGQAAGTAAALCVAKKCEPRELPYSELRNALIKNNVYLEG